VRFLKPATARLLAVSMAGAAAVAAGACGRRASQAQQKADRSIVWRQLGSWAGRDSLQTESFTSDSGTLRIRWETSLVLDGDSTGSFRLTAHSAISGRLLEQVVDHTGAGQGVGYVQQDPHVFYVVVESTQLNWRFTVEEAIEYP
jgi:hypothetical protein